jgi:ATP/maltotriose-dependent transcriptional regulator MalT
MTLDNLVWVQLEAGEVAAAAAAVAQAGPVADGLPVVIRARLLGVESLVRYEQDEMGEAERASEAALALLGPQRASRDHAMVVSVQALVARARGDAVAHELLAEKALKLARAVAWPESIALGEAVVADLLLDRGEVEAARARFDLADQPVAREAPLPAIILGRVAARLRAAEGDLAGALVDLEHLRRRSAEAGFDLMQGEVELVLAELLFQAGRAGEAHDVATSLVARAGVRGQDRLARLAREQLARLDA